MNYTKNLERNNSRIEENNGGFREILAAVEELPDIDGIHTEEATAVAGDILAGKTAYADGKKLTGTIPTVTQTTPSISVSDGGLITASTTQSAGYVAGGTKTATKQLPVQGAQTITPGTKEQTIPASRYLTGEQKILGDEGLVPENIAAGVSIFGVTGTLEAGSNPCLLAGTPIDMADGSVKAVEELRAGDLVQSYDPVNGTLTAAVVVDAYVTGYSRKFAVYSFSDGRFLTVYGQHGIYNAANGTTKDIQALNRNDKIVNIDGETVQWTGARDMFYHGAKKRRYNVVTSNNLYFANGILLGHKPFSKLQRVLDAHITVSEEIRAVWQSDCDAYNAYNAFLVSPEFHAEMKEASQKRARAEHIISVNKKRLSDSDYKAQKYVEGVLPESEWQSAKDKRAAWRKEIGDHEGVLEESRKRCEEIVLRYRGDTTARSMFEACCTRDNAIFEAVKAHFAGEGEG